MKTENRPKNRYRQRRLGWPRCGQTAATMDLEIAWTGSPKYNYPAGGSIPNGSPTWRRSWQSPEEASWFFSILSSVEKVETMHHSGTICSRGEEHDTGVTHSPRCGTKPEVRRPLDGVRISRQASRVLPACSKTKALCVRNTLEKKQAQLTTYWSAACRSRSKLWQCRFAELTVPVPPFSFASLRRPDRNPTSVRQIAQKKPPAAFNIIRFI